MRQQLRGTSGRVTLGSAIRVCLGSAIGLLAAIGALGCSDTVEDGVYACMAPGQGTDCPADWYCRTDPEHPTELRCHERAGPPVPPAPPGGIGSVCDMDDECSSAHCSNGRCSPDGFAWVDAGDFLMGSPDHESFRNTDEELHLVTLTRPFLIGTTEVTQAQWSSVLPDSSPSYWNTCGDDCPVERINFYEAMGYANARSVAEGLEPCYELEGCQGTRGAGCLDTTMRQPACHEDMPEEPIYRCTNVTFVGLDCSGYRLPTEAEWEYAARAGSSDAYPQVAVSSAVECDAGLERVGWYACNSEDRTHRVGELEPNLWGLHDTVGNVFEMVWDDYGPFGSLVGPAVDPLGPTRTIGGSNQVFRGGAYERPRSDCRSAFRGHSGSLQRTAWIGFRIARTIVTAGDGS